MKFSRSYFSIVIRHESNVKLSKLDGMSCGHPEFLSNVITCIMYDKSLTVPWNYECHLKFGNNFIVAGKVQRTFIVIDLSYIMQIIALLKQPGCPHDIPSN